MQASRSLLYGVTAASVASLALSIHATFGGRPAAAPAAAAACACDEASLRGEIADLKRALAAQGEDARVQRLAARIEALEAKAGAPAPSAERNDGPAAGSARPAAARAEPVFTAFELPSPAVRVRQDPGGGLAVTNTDPSMTGKYLTIKATAADGTTQDVHVIVPPPGQ